MAYNHDIFISYRRDKETCAWIAEHLKPLLELRVGLDLGRRPVIYLDEQLESGGSWPLDLGMALGCSRTLIMLWSKNYLASEWCARELTHMLVREKREGLRTVARPHGLVIPAFIHDGEDFPPCLGHIQHFEIQKCFNVRMARNSPRAEELDAALAQQAPAIATSIANAPEWTDSWPALAAAELFEQFYRQIAPEQQTVPRFTG